MTPSSESLTKRFNMDSVMNIPCFSSFSVILSVTPSLCEFEFLNQKIPVDGLVKLDVRHLNTIFSPSFTSINRYDDDDVIPVEDELLYT